jgi:DNA-binding MurR/RpiR family transcriptional regulator
LEWKYFPTPKILDPQVVHGIMNVLTKINSFFSSLTKTERKIAQYVAVNTDEIGVLSIDELAKRVGVAETTVIRFARKLDFKGYQDFKMALVQDVVSESARKNKYSDNPQTAFVSKYVDYMLESGKTMSQQDVGKAAALINQARKVCVFGVGISGIVALYLKAQMIRNGIDNVFDLDTHLQAIDLALLTEADVVVAISQSGNTTDLVRNVELAKKRRVQVIAITNYATSSLVDAADITIVAAPGNGAESAEAMPVMGQIMAIDLIGDQLRAINPERTNAFRDKMNEVLIDKL